MSGPGPQLPSGDPRLPALSMVRPPAFFLLCTGTLHIFFSLVGLVLALFKVTSPFASATGTPTTLELNGSFLLILLVSVICGVLSVWGALNAMQLKGYGLVMVGAITALNVMSPACVVGVPVAVWMLFTLRRDGVRESFAP